MGGAIFHGTACNKNNCAQLLDKTPRYLLLCTFYVAKYKSKASVILHDKWQFIFALLKSGQLKIKHSLFVKT